MVDPAAPPPPDPAAAPAELVDELVDEIVVQAAELRSLDGPRAEVWAADVLALAAELGPDDGERALVDSLAARPEPAAGVALTALSAFVAVPRAAATPWQEALGSSSCTGAWMLTSGASRSAAFAFVDAVGAGHTLTVDLLPGPLDSAGDSVGESAGEVAVGPPELLEAAREEDARITVEAADPAWLAGQVARAVARTDGPPDSLVRSARLVARRLGPLTDEVIPIPRFTPDEVPPPPDRDPADDAYAVAVLHRALGATDLAAPSAAELAVEAVAATVAPADLAPFTPAEREAIGILEWADWLGAVIGIVRAGAGAPVAGEDLVDAVNRCPEVTTTIPRADRGRVAWAFETLTAPWAELGLVDQGRLTELGGAVLPAALTRAWSRAEPPDS